MIMEKRTFRRMTVACAAAAALLAGTGLPAAATPIPGWRQVFSAHFGAAGNYPLFDAAVAFSAKSAWVFGGTNVDGAPSGTPVAERWNGKTWSQSALPKGVTDDVTAASAPAADDIWAVTGFGGYVLHWNGKTWSVAKRLPAPKGALVPAQLTGVVATSATNVWVFGTSGSTLGLGTWHYNGKSWSQWYGNTLGIAEGSAVSAADIWAVRDGGYVPQTDIVHYTKTWKVVTASALSGLTFLYIDALTATDVWASAVSSHNEAQSWLVHYNGRTWSKLRVPWTMQRGAGGLLASDGHGGLWLNVSVQSGSKVQLYEAHRSAKGVWSRTPVSAVFFSMANIPGTTSLWAAGYEPGVLGKAFIWAYGAV